MSKLVYGVGFNSKKYRTNVNGKMTKEYNLWVNMLRRCYSDKYHSLKPTYIDCTVSDNFLHYEYFYEWCQKQVGFENSGWQLDKDLLVKDNKVYSESTCFFLPREVNMLLVKKESCRGDSPIGVCYDKQNKKFKADMSLGGGKKKHLGLFNSEIEAFNTYKVAKENRLKELAEKWKGEIDNRAYNALMNYQVEITD